MAITTERIIGKDLTVSAAGVTSKWRDIDITLTKNSADATASDSTADEIVLTTDLLEGTISVFQGSDNNSGTLPMPGDTITVPTITIGVDSVLPVMTAYTNLKVTSANYTYGQEPAVASFSFRSGVLN